MNLKKIISKHWIILLILILALITRLYHIEVFTSFQGDQGRDLLNVFQIVHDHDIKLLGPPSTFGPFHGPLFFYALVPSMFFSRYQMLGILLTPVSLGVLGIIFLYLYCLRFFSKRVAVVAAFLFSISPLLVETGRTLLNGYFGIPLVIAAIYLATEIFTHSKSRAVFIIALGFVTGSLVQLHYSFGIITIFCFILPFFFHQVKKVKYFLLFISSFLVASLLQIIFELTHSFLDVHLLLNNLISGKTVGHFSLEYLSFFVSSVGYLFGFENKWYGLSILIIFGMLIFFFFRKLGKPGQITVKILLGYLFFFLLVALGSKIRIGYPAYHYYSSIFPVMIILASVLLARLPGKIIVLILVAFTATSIINLNFSRDNGFTMRTHWSLQRQEKIADSIAADVKGKTDWNVAEVLDGDTNAQPFRYLLSARGAENYLGVADYPRSKILYLITPDGPEKVADTAVWEVQSFKPFKVSKVWVEYNGINLYRLDKI